ncbi:lectin ADEL-like [Aplysia californica]|uniref:Lectin ADEL-like n=1 Tax=Aplysia californica TaxID=6500 RepID=A0ABM1VZ41_APLCA|nr:lectin ADEL-like [Aplysia californica]
MESWSYEYSEKIVENTTWVLNMTVVDRQSATECTLGESFGYQKATLWVNHGCRAAFKVCYLPVRSTKCKVLRMESLNYEYAEQKVKKAALFINMTVEDQQSEASCDLDKSFGFDNQKSIVWVNYGCRAEFNVCYMKGISSTTTVNVSSWNYQHATKMLSSASCIYSMQVAKQQSTAACTFGTSFGFVGNTMWVNDGCRADFSVDYYTA